MLGVLPFVEDPDLSVSAARTLAQHVPPCIYLLEISRLWFLSFNICRDDHVHHHRRHFPEPGVRRLGERAKGTGGARIVEAHLQVEPESVFCNVHCTL